MPRTSGQFITTATEQPGARLAQLLTTKRITLHATLLAVFLWSAYAVNLATPGLRDRAGNVKGADFLHFYIAGTLVRTGHLSSLYDPGAHAAYQKALLPESAGAYFVPMYGPQVYLLFVPLTRLSYGWAALLCALLNMAIYSACVYALVRRCPHLKPYRFLVFLLAAGYPAFFSLIAFGQSSAPALALFTLAFFALQTRRPFLAGLAIGSLVYKPQLGLAAAFILLAAAQWRIVAGAVAAIAAQMGVAWACFGSEIMRRYGEAFLRLGNVQALLEPKLYQMHSMRSFWMLLLPWKNVALALYVLSAAAILALGLMCWRRASDLRLRYAALLTCSVLVAPHLWIYDLVILAPALLLIGDWTQEKPTAYMTPAIRILLYACYALPLLGPAARITHVQLSIVAFTALLLALSSATQEVQDNVFQPTHG